MGKQNMNVNESTNILEKEYSNELIKKLSMKDNPLATTIAGVSMKSPIATASGTFGYGLEFENEFDLNTLGAINVKGLSLQKVIGNPTPRVVEVQSGMLNAIGLQNIGVHDFIENVLPNLRKYQTPIIVNFWGKSVEDYVEVAEILNNIKEVAILEMNISCPNIKEGGIQFGVDLSATSNLVDKVRRVITNKKLAVKLSPNVHNIGDFAKACEDFGADIISAINTLTGLALHPKTHKPILANITGGLSGPAVKPVGLAKIFEIRKRVRLPIFGMGGIVNATDVIDYIAVGANAVQIGTANFMNTKTCYNITDQLMDYCYKNDIKNIAELHNIAHQM